MNSLLRYFWNTKDTKKAQRTRRCALCVNFVNFVLLYFSGTKRTKQILGDLVGFTGFTYLNLHMDSNTGKYIILAGVLVIVLGVIIYFFHDKLHWIGRLPGDIRVERENFKFYFPITSMILFSVLATVIIYIVRRWL